MARVAGMAKGLTPRQERFCVEYLVDLNAAQAAARAGYSARTARVQGSALLAQPMVRARVEVLKRERNARVRVEADYVLARLMELDAMDVRDVLDEHGGMLPLAVWPAVWRRSVSEVEVVEGKGTAIKGTVAKGSAVKGGEDLPDGAVCSAAVVVRKLKWPDRLKVLELIAKHVAAGAGAGVGAHDGVPGADGDEGAEQLSEMQRAAKVASLLALARARQTQARAQSQGETQQGARKRGATGSVAGGAKG